MSPAWIAEKTSSAIPGRGKDPEQGKITLTLLIDDDDHDDDDNDDDDDDDDDLGPPC